VVRLMLQRTEVDLVLCEPEWVDRLGGGVRIRVAPRCVMDELTGVPFHQRIMALGRIPPVGPPQGSLWVALDGISSAENVGAILRSCAAFGVEAVFIGPRTASPWLRRAVRVSCGAGLQVPIHSVSDLASLVRPLQAWAAHLYGERVNYTEVDYSGPCCLVFGSEAEGVSSEVLSACRGIVHIPMSPGWDCLNVAASAAVILSEAMRQRGALVSSAIRRQ
jgi:tRNA G18 (ribose-2'-O)-methylase SpoU